MNRLYRSFVFAAVVCAGVAAVEAQSMWSPEMQVKTKAIASTRVSPDGQWVVYSVSDVMMTPDRGEYVSQLWLASADGKDTWQLTYGDKSSSNAKWSPDGSMIAFTSTRKDNRNNLYAIRVRGGEAEALTDLKSSVGDFDWSPDGRWIAYTMTDPKSEDEEKNDKSRNDFRWVDENVKMARLYVIPFAKSSDGKREPRRLAADGRHVTGFDWSPDGRTIAVSHVISPVANFWPTSDVSLVDVATGKLTPLATTEASEGGPIFSPDGKWIAVNATDLPNRWAGSSKITIYPAGGGSPRAMRATYDGQPNILGWTPDGSKLLFTESKGTGTALYEAEVASGSVKEQDYQDAAIGSVNLTRTPSGPALAMVVQHADAPPEAYVVTPASGKMIRISHANDDMARMPIGKTEIVKWKSTDGRDIEGLLTYPIGYQAGTKAPLILNIHGGPTGVFTQSYLGGRGVYPLATFSQKGYAILRVNPRGSSGYGTAFRQANIKDWGGMDYQDLMTGVDKVIAMGIADPERLGVMGWSYGGYMTSWIITQTKRFKAASAGAPVTNLMSFNGTADIPSFVPDYFGGQAWENPEIYAKHSAMFNIKGVTTPTLIEHGDADVRVPISQGYELYNALKAQGVPTRMIVLPRQPHGPTEPRMQMAAMQANLDWFEKYLGTR